MSTSHRPHRFPHPASIFWTLVALIMLTACHAPPPVVETPTSTPVPAATTIPTGAHEYHVVPENSLLQILVYRGGTMARLGHNHVIASHQLTGSVYMTNDPLQTRFDIQFPVNELSIDDPELREQAGADFPPGVPQSARDGTRANMLSDKLLDGSNYPTIRLRATDVMAVGSASDTGTFDVGVEITIRNQVHNLRVPVTLETKDGALKASGEFVLKQSELGLKPFSVAMGTLLVLDEMHIRFEVIARE